MIQFLKRHSVRIVIGVVLVAAVYGLMIISAPYQKEQRIARKLKAFDVEFDSQYCGPAWVPQTLRYGLPFLWRFGSTKIVLPIRMGVDPDTSKPPAERRLITDEELADISELEHISMMTLSVAQISDAGLMHLGKMPRLLALFLNGNDRQRGSQGPAKITAAGLRHLEGLRGLLYLSLCSLQITDDALAGLEEMTQLRLLSLDNTAVTDAGLGIFKEAFPNLESLSLNGNQITDTGLEHLKDLTGLINLSLYGTQVTDAGLKHLSGLTNLSELSLDETQVTEEGLDTLKGLPSLKTLHLDGTRITAAGRARLRKLMPNCTIMPDP